MELAATAQLQTSVSVVAGERPSCLMRVFRSAGDAFYRFILVRVGNDRHAADDLLQQACAVAASHRRTPSDDQACEAWLRGIARNLIRRHWRTLRRARRSVSADDPRVRQQLMETLERSHGSGTLTLDAESAQQLILAVTALPAADQDLVFAFYFDGRSQEDIAAASSTTAKSVEARLYRARGRLRAMLRAAKGAV